MENAYQLKTDRSLVKLILLSIVTCGIYSIIFFTGVANDINVTATRRDGKKTMHYCLLYFLVAPITCGIAGLVWWHKIAGRIGEEARARGINTNFGASTFWLWRVLGSFIIVGPFVYLYKLCEVMNEINADFNQKGM